MSKIVLRVGDHVRFANEHPDGPIRTITAIVPAPDAPMVEIAGFDGRFASHIFIAVEPLEVDRSARCLADGSPVTEDHREIDPVTGQQKDYVVLCPDERARGFVEPVRRTYIHVGRNPVMKGHVLIRAGENGCGTRTTMGLSIAETYARDPGFYSGTFCCNCHAHFPLEEFVWEGTTLQVGKRSTE